MREQISWFGVVRVFTRPTPTSHSEELGKLRGGRWIFISLEKKNVARAPERAALKRLSEELKKRA